MKKSLLGKFLAAVSALIASVMVFSVAGCETGGNKLPSGESHGLSLISYSLEVDAGATSPLIVTSALMQDVVWTTSDSAVATVEGEGLNNMACTISAHSAGVATITATSGSNWATCVVSVIDPEVILITKDGGIVDEVTLGGKGDTVKLAASSSRKHDIKWESANELIATVDGSGLVKAETVSGTVDIIARCAQHSNVLSSITLKVGDGVDSAYWLKNSYQDDSIVGTMGTWYYWNEYPNVVDAKYVEGVVSFDAVDLKKGANWYNVKLAYTASSADKDADGNSLKINNLYGVTFNLDITKAGTITANGYVLKVSPEVKTYTAYFRYKGLAFEMLLGVDGYGCDLVEENFSVKVSNLSWKTAQEVQLETPTFTIDANNKITINDPNPEGVGSYTLNLYDENGAKVRSVLVENKQTIDMSKVPAGTYTAQLIANAQCEPFITAPETKANSNNTVVSTTEVKDLSYDIVYGGQNAALREAGSWTYWSSTWVTFVNENNSGEDYDGVSGKVIGNKAHVSFKNNAGWWYDTQLWYKLPDAVKDKTYKVTLHIDNIPNDGWITVNGGFDGENSNSTVVQEVKAGNNTIEIEFTETDGASLQIIFGKTGQTDHLDIKSATDVVIYFEIVEVEKPEVEETV